MLVMISVLEFVLLCLENQ